jgi:transcriptional regulator with XRE-family HTH domain
MNTVERIKSICKERKIPISRLEIGCGFSNAYISGLKKGTLPNDRLIKIAEYLDVSVEYLLYGEDYSIEGAKLQNLIRTDMELSKALLKYFNLSDEKKKHVVELINLLSE